MTSPDDAVRSERSLLHVIATPEATNVLGAAFTDATSLSDLVHLTAYTREEVVKTCAALVDVGALTCDADGLYSTNYEKIVVEICSMEKV